jgi:predicted hydrolase (HD superfamily)
MCRAWPSGCGSRHRCSLRGDAELLVATALSHDVGYAPEIAQAGFHPLDGARYLREIGAPERLCALVTHHTCAYRETGLRELSAELNE